MPQLILRKALLADADVLRRWRNDPETRDNSFNSSEVREPEHRSWLESVLKNPARHLFIAELDGTAVGTGRADFQRVAYELSWSIAYEFRGRGLGLQLVSQLSQKFRPCIAKIKVGNRSSILIAEKLGFEKIDEECTILTFFLARE